MTASVLWPLSELNSTTHDGLPVELFSHILGYLSTNDLKSLGLVDRDCRRVTAPYYFKDMKTYFAPDKCSHLFREISCQATSNVPAQLSPSRIASCVRRLTVASDSPNRPIPDYSTIVSEYEGLPIEDVDIPLTSFLRSISSVVEKSLPNLHILDWDAPTFISRSLRQLIWNGYLSNDEIHVSDDMPPFPNLRSVSFDTVSSNSDKILRHFLGPYTRVETLCMDSMTTSTQKFYRTRGYIPSLKRFCWLNHGQGDASPYDDIILFLENNPQLEALHIPDPVLPTFIGLSLLPTLQSHFDALVSLHLVWASSSIHDESLQAISSISTLRHLWCQPEIKICKALPVDLDISKYLSASDLDIYRGKSVDFGQASDVYLPTGMPRSNPYPTAKRAMSSLFTQEAVNDTLASDLIINL
ncbi:hypothetical protein BDZ97DRAFT_1756006 [Flammula alnicola]|nr:hypothetical protein BDZ97DRAFT_1756006 [Flammula alnicola]